MKNEGKTPYNQLEHWIRHADSELIYEIYETEKFYFCSLQKALTGKTERKPNISKLNCS